MSDFLTELMEPADDPDSTPRFVGAVVPERFSSSADADDAERVYLESVLHGARDPLYGMSSILFFETLDDVRYLDLSERDRGILRSIGVEPFEFAAIHNMELAER